MNSSIRISNGGVGFCGLLTIVFVVLKFTGVINWSWIWVLSPLWIGALATIILIILFAIIAAVVANRW